MNYETVKRLKEAGFPQKEANGFVGLYNLDEGDEKGQAYFPDLSELVKECGDKFHYLSNTSKFKDLNGDTREWVAHSKDHTRMGLGETPDIAVANLYLALHPSE